VSEASRQGWDAVVLDASDNLATALRHLKAGETARFKIAGAVRELTMQTDVALCHKFAVETIAAGDTVRKYGETIGLATAAITAGAHAHVHNIKSLRAMRP